MSKVWSTEKLAYKDAEAIAAEYRAGVHYATKLSDIVEPPIGDDFQWATRAHIDLLIRDDDLEPLVAIEVDGSHHREPEQARRDRLKDRLLRAAGVDVIRVTAETVRRQHGRSRLTGYLAKLWFSSRAFYEAQEQGDVPMTEEFFHSGTFVFDPQSGKMTPLDPSMGFRQRLWTDNEKNGIPAVPVPQLWFLESPRLGTVRAKALLALNEYQFLFADVEVGAIDIPGLFPTDIAEEVALLELESEYKAWTSGEARGIHIRELRSHLPPSASYERTDTWGAHTFYSGMATWISRSVGAERAAKLFLGNRFGSIIPDSKRSPRLP